MVRAKMCEIRLISLLVCQNVCTFVHFMTYDFSIEDPTLGRILVRRSSRARRLIFRVEAELGLVVTVPLWATEKTIREGIRELHPRLEKMLKRAQDKQSVCQITPSFRIDSQDFHFWSEEAPVERMMVRQQQGALVCYYPAGQSFENPQIQQWLISMIEESMRQHAQVFFPPRLQALAWERGLRFTKVSIHKSHGRWGSCSTAGRINLSLYLLLLPRHLQDYVMQHELTHLVSMDHSPRFWKLLDEALDGHSKEYRDEMKGYDTTIFCLTQKS